MFRFLTSLFADDAAPNTPANKFRPQLSAMEDRYTPASLATVAFDPQPEPPLAARTVRVSTASVPGTGDIPGTGDHSGLTRGIIVTGG